MPRLPTLSLMATAASVALLAGCAAPNHTQVRAEVRVAAPAPAWTPPASVVSVYVEPPMVQPEPVLVDVAPPPMLVDVPPPPPGPQAVWVGGYWGWQGRWVWCAGHWMAPPQASYVWTQPYYEHRDGAVIFIAGHWAAAGVAFVPPPASLHLSLQISLDGGARPIGPAGVFVPPPPGSRAGLVVPAPVGTPPAVVVSAPPVINVGMRVTNNVNTTNIHNNITNVTNITNATQVTVVAPPAATANGQAFQGNVPAQAHLAAALPAVVQARAPKPAHAAPMATEAGFRAAPPAASSAPPLLPPQEPPHAARVAEPAGMPPPHAALSMAQPAAPSSPAPNAPAQAWTAAPHTEVPAPHHEVLAPPPTDSGHPPAAPTQPRTPHRDPTPDKAHGEAQAHTPAAPVAPAHAQPAAHTPATAPAPAQEQGHHEPHTPHDKEDPRREHHGEEAR